MENTEKTPNPEALLDQARNVAASLAVATQSELVSSFIGSAVMDNDFIRASVGAKHPLAVDYLDEVVSAWKNSPFSDDYLIDTRSGSFLSIDELQDALDRTCQTYTTNVDGHQVSITTFPTAVDETDISRDEFEYDEIEALETRLYDYLQSDDVAVPDRHTSTGCTRLLFFLTLVKFQIDVLSELCPGGVTPKEDEADDDSEEEWEEDDSDPFEDESVVGWGEDVEWRFGGEADEIGTLTDDNLLIDPQSTPGNIKWVRLSTGMSNREALEELGGDSEQDGSVSRQFNYGIIMKYTYDGCIGDVLPTVDASDDDIDGILTNYVSAWQSAHIERGNRSWFSLSDAFHCLYGQAHLYKAYLLRQRKADLEESDIDERSKSEFEELAAIPAQIAEQEAEGASYLASYQPNLAP